jgi:hypothetical protein
MKLIGNLIVIGLLAFGLLVVVGQVSDIRRLADMGFEDILRRGTIGR